MYVGTRREVNGAQTSVVAQFAGLITVDVIALAGQLLDIRRIMQDEFIKRVLIRAAKPADAEAIIHVHYAAVHQIASAFYPSEIINDWS